MTIPERIPGFRGWRYRWWDRKAIEDDIADAPLVEWGHWLGGCNRPFGRQSERSLASKQEVEMWTASFFTDARLDRHDPRRVSIARTAPIWGQKMRRYPRLAPPRDLLDLWHTGRITWQGYTDRYIAEVLGALDAETVRRELGEDAILCCWESYGPEMHCHRRLVAQWFERECGLVVPEWGVSE